MEISKIYDDIYLQVRGEKSLMENRIILEYNNIDVEKLAMYIKSFNWEGDEVLIMGNWITFIIDGEVLAKMDCC